MVKTNKHNEIGVSKSTFICITLKIKEVMEELLSETIIGTNKLIVLLKMINPWLVISILFYRNFWQNIISEVCISFSKS